MDFWLIGFLLISGLVIGSFLSSFTTEVSKAKFSPDYFWRRSRCPKCGRQIKWADNIPLLSYLMLGGKCQACRKPISKRYPLIEAATAVVFVSLFSLGGMSGWTLLYALFLVVGFLALAIVDLERQIIPDRIIIPLIIIHFSILTFFASSPVLFANFFWASAASVFFFGLHTLTRGRGMGLGDVKLAFLIGLVLGEDSWVAIFLSFIIGAVVGVLLIILGRARFGKPIPFGPFLVLGVFLTLLWRDKIEMMLLGV